MTKPRYEAAEARRKAHAALAAGDLAGAQRGFLRVTELEPGDLESWMNLAITRRAVGDRAGELAALNQVLILEPRELVALLLKGANRHDVGRTAEAAQAFSAALAIAPPDDQVPPDFKGLIALARQVVGHYGAAQAQAVDTYLAPVLSRHEGARLSRFKDSVDVFLGRKQHYHRAPHVYHFPGLPETQFYDRADFPWLKAFEDATDQIRDEFLAILQKDEGFEPYIQYAADRPLDQWEELNHNPRWSAYHLTKDGGVRAEHAAHCPLTMRLLQTAPQAILPGRSPAAMFSVLQPRTRIPPHTGVTNVRLVVHVPLILPEGCWFRVGNDTRPWKLGEAFVFDDTIEHEAVNDSDHVRVVLIFDIWHPDLTSAERDLIGAMFRGADAFSG